MRASTFRRLMNLWPPFFFNSIRVQYVAEDWSEVKVVLRLRPWNRNYVRTQFGGNLLSMLKNIYDSFQVLKQNQSEYDEKADFLATPSRAIRTYGIVFSGRLFKENQPMSPCLWGSPMEGSP